MSHSHRNNAWGVAKASQALSSQHPDALLLHFIFGTRKRAMLSPAHCQPSQKDLGDTGNSDHTGPTQLISRRQHSMIFHPTHPCHFLAYFTADSGTSAEVVHLLKDRKPRALLAMRWKRNLRSWHFGIKAKQVDKGRAQGWGKYTKAAWFLCIFSIPSL